MKLTEEQLEILKKVAPGDAKLLRSALESLIKISQDITQALDEGNYVDACLRMEDLSLASAALSVGTRSMHRDYKEALLGNIHPLVHALQEHAVLDRVQALLEEKPAHPTDPQRKPN